ncbi:hypothetical protein SDC9_64170 [bioreactor metagenome]|uniref:Uncharacterized protein n=1 Tax=bioreactor metagenome TaxID=1076179 RepID=A0A644XPR7_9ZZZZ
MTYGLFDVNLGTGYAILDDINEIKKMNKMLKVKLTCGYMTTAYLHFRIIKNDRAVFFAEIFAEEDNNEGIQSPYIGWTEIAKENSLINFLKKFRPVEKDSVSKFLTTKP